MFSADGVIDSHTRVISPGQSIAKFISACAAWFKNAGVRGTSLGHPFFPVWEAMGAALKKMLGMETCGGGMKESAKKLL